VLLHPVTRFFITLMAKNELHPVSEDNINQLNQDYSCLVLVERKSYIQLYAEHRSGGLV